MDATTMKGRDFILTFLEENQVNKSHFTDDMPSVWQGNWYVDSEIGKLRHVLMRRPGKEIDNLGDNWAELSLLGPLNPDKIRAEHDNMVKTYQQCGVEVHLIDDKYVREDVPNIMFCRDLVNGSPCGALVSRMGVKVRSPEVKSATMKLGELGVPIAKTINGTGTFEGACLMWIDKETALIGQGTRSNAAGMRQMRNELAEQGVKEIVHVDLPHNDIHLDGMIGIADYDKVIMNLDVVPEHVVEAFRKRGFQIIEIDSAESWAAANFVAVEPGKIVMCQGVPVTQKKMEAAGIECIPIPVDNIRVAAGAIHCCTAFLQRDPVPVYEVKEL